jgi:ferrochelatase
MHLAFSLPAFAIPTVNKPGMTGFQSIPRKPGSFGLPDGFSLAAATTSLNGINVEKPDITEDFPIRSLSSTSISNMTAPNEPQASRTAWSTWESVRPESNNTSLPKGRVGVLLASHGDIDNLDELEQYAKTAVLKNRAIPLPDFLRVPAAQLGWLFVRDGIVDQYESIGLETHYRERSAEQARAVAQALQARGVDAKAYFGFNFAPPFVADAMEQMRRDGVEHVVVFNQGAQYSFATTAENVRDVQEFLNAGSDKNEPFRPSAVGVRQFSEDPRFRDLLVRRIKEDIDNTFPGVPYSDICVLMGSHGLPKPLQEKGDPATQQMAAATEDIRQRLPEDLKIFQGFLNDDFFPGVPWTQPTVESLAEEIAATGRKHILLDGRLSFTVHHRATYYDLNTEARDAIQALAPDANIVLANNFDGDATLADLIAEITLEALAGKGDIERIAVVDSNAEAKPKRESEALGSDRTLRTTHPMPSS